MLTRLTIQNFVLITDETLHVGPGLNVLTGSSGAGKSLVLNALRFVLGGRPPAGLSVDKAKTPRVVAEFDLPDPAVRARIAQILDLDWADDETLVLARRLTPAGKTAATANGLPIAAASLRAVAPLLADLHGQGDQHRLLAPAYQLQLIDRAAAVQTHAPAVAPTANRPATGHRKSTVIGDDDRESVPASTIRLSDTASAADGERSITRASAASPSTAEGPTDRLADRYGRWQALLARQAQLAADADLRGQRLELARFQRDEIESADVQPDEWESTVERHQKLAHLDALRAAAAAVVNGLTEADEPILDRLSSLTATLEKLVAADPALDPLVANLSAAAVGLDETARQLRDYVDGLDLDPGELADVETRLTQLRRLADKYGPTTADVLSRGEALRGEIDRLEALQTDTAALETDIAAAEKAFREAALAMRQRRAAVIPKLARQINGQLKALGMPRARFEIEFVPAEPGPTGIDRAEYLIRTNPGQAMQPLRKIASGGELSRVMLAIRSVLAEADATPLLVFDEIDANVGGRAGGVIAERLKGLARHQQILCISHLPQVAAYADGHWTVRKRQTDAATETAIEAMDDRGRIGELAEMIGGAHVTATTRRQARELVALATGRRAPAVPETDR
jgi:DNA repair protein RecN (Recombination protein N)